MPLMHIADAWRSCNELVERLAETYPHAQFTAVRDIYGRSSFAIEGLDDDAFNKVAEDIYGREQLKPYFAPLVVQALDRESPLGKLILSLRTPLSGHANAFVVERLLSNESWLRGSGENPPNFPPIVAFYSFKGGVGRTTAAALTSLTLAREGKRVVLIDLDLEAPGIERLFFQHYPKAGVVDYLLERSLLGQDYRPDMDDFVMPYWDEAMAARGGSLIVVPAGLTYDDTYMERLGRINLAEIARQTGAKNAIRALIADLLTWRQADLILVDCRTGFTELGGMTLNGLSDLDVLVFRAGEADRGYLPIVLRHIHRFRQSEAVDLETADRLARSFLIVFTMVELPAKTEEAEQYLGELRTDASEACWKEIFQRFEPSGYTNPSPTAEDAPYAPVPHDVVRIPYLREFSLVAKVTSMMRLQSERPEKPYDVLARRIVDVKLAPRLVRPSAAQPVAVAPAVRQAALGAIERLVEKASAEHEFSSPEDFQRRFLPRGAYRTLLDPKAFLVLGRKGAGKSALFQLLNSGVYLKEMASHLLFDADLIERTKWDVGFEASKPGFPTSDDFFKVMDDTGADPDLMWRYWRALLVFCASRVLDSPLTELPTLDACRTTLREDSAQKAIARWLETTHARLASQGRYLCLSYDDLDTGISRDVQRRDLLLAALIDYWQQASRSHPRIRAKIFLREDIWERLTFTDKAKVRDGIDRATITWDGLDIYRAVLKRLGHEEELRQFLRQEGLWTPEFDKMVQQPLGFIPPSDETWVRKGIEMLAGEAMAAGEWGHKKGYVYTWILTHLGDATGGLRPRSALLLFSEAAKSQATAPEAGPLLKPRSLITALKGEVSRMAVDDLRAEFSAEWSVMWSGQSRWVPDLFSTFERIWPVKEDDLLNFLAHGARITKEEAQDLIQRMVDGGLLERRQKRKKAPVELQIPDIYLFGLGLTRHG